MNKITALQSIIYSNSFSCFCVTETWLHNSICDNEILSDFMLYRCDRSSRGGGVMIAVSDHIHSRQISTSSRAEIVIVELALSPKLIICCVYIPPASPDQYLSDILSTLNTLPTDCDLIITGDFNTPHINWNTLTGSSSFASSLCTTIDSLNLIQLVHEPTHNKGNIIDLVLTNSPDKINNLNVDLSVSQFTTSDHFLISFDFFCRNTQSVHYKAAKKFNYSQANFFDIECHFLDCNFKFISSTISINNAWFFLKDSLLHTCDMFIPTCSLHSKKTPPLVQCRYQTFAK